MAEAYASLVSLTNIIDQIMYHGRNSFSLNHEQIQSLQERAAFLVDFLEGYSHGDNKEVEALESKIADASHAAEDLIESKVVDYIHENQSTSFDETISNHFCHRLQEMIEVMDLMNKEAMKIKEKGKLKVQLPRDSILSSSSSSLPAGKDTMVGFDDVMNQIMERLTRQQFDRQIIPIFGMGGIGKTTLARNVYENPYIVHHFNIRAWVTISQEYQIKEILSSLLIEFGVNQTQEMNESQLGETLHKYLFGRRYLIVMDDMWSTDVWEKVQLFFPVKSKGSGIMITTRLTNMASHLGSSGLLEMDFLDEDRSWNLLRQKVFGQQECSLELEEIGKKIAKNCKGLPLSIVVIAGLLAKSSMTTEYWEHVAQEVNSIVSLADDGRCSKILSLSYINLPVHLKPCFLYAGIFPEDSLIYVPKLIKLWVAEGFLKPNKAKSLEEVAEEYLIDLIDRNLIMVHMQGSLGRMKYCKIHDLLGDICLREAHKEKFLYVTGRRGFDYSQTLQNQRRIVIDISKKEQKSSANFNNQGTVSVYLLRSITFNFELGSSFLGHRNQSVILDISKKEKRSYFNFNNQGPVSVSFRRSINMDSSLLGCRLIRVSNGKLSLFETAFDLVNIRYLNFTSPYHGSFFRCPSKINLLWNLQTLVIEVYEVGTTAPPEIWEMKQLRHLYLYTVNLPEPPPLIAAIDDGTEDFNMKHLQTLKGVLNLTCSEGVVKKIPNIKKLPITYDDFKKDYSLSNLQHLHKLESLYIRIDSWGSGETHFLENLIFPHSLKKLSFYRSRIPWEHMTIIGLLPNLEVLKLRDNAFIGEEWNPIEGQFLSLKYLKILYCDTLKLWNADNIHFPNLEQLFISGMTSLENIPLGIGEMPTLRSILLGYCSDSVVNSVIDILDEQEIQGNDGIQVEVWLLKNKTQLMNLEARDNLKFNFR